MAKKFGAEATTTAVESIFQEDLVLLGGEEEANDISFWEVVNPSDADSDNESLLSIENGFVSWVMSSPSPPESPKANQETLTQDAYEEQDVVNRVDDGKFYVEHESSRESWHMFFPDLGGLGLQCCVEDVKQDVVNHDNDSQNLFEDDSNCERCDVYLDDLSDVGLQCREDDEDDEEEEDDGCGLDDELVPRHLSGKLGRQRMRKLGKRVFAKMSHSKRNPYRYVKPGCVYGKHGLGIKA